MNKLKSQKIHISNTLLLRRTIRRKVVCDLKKIFDRVDKLVSIIIPVYKVEEYLEECVLSAINQTYEELEIILVDDGSPDKCPRMCDEFARLDNRIKVIHQKNGGLSNARNKGIQEATGKYLYFLDSDDYLDTKAIEKLLVAAERDNSDFCFCDAKAFSDDNKIFSSNENLTYTRKKDYGCLKGSQMAKKLYDNEEFKTSAALLFIKRDFLNETNILFYEGILHEDNLFTVSLFLAANKCTHVHSELYNRRVHEDSIMTRPFCEKNYHGYFICTKELILLYRTKYKDEDMRFLVDYIKMLSLVLSDKYHKFNSKEKNLVLNEYVEIKSLMKEYRYFGDWKFYVQFRFWLLRNMYIKLKKG